MMVVVAVVVVVVVVAVGVDVILIAGNFVVCVEVTPETMAIFFLFNYNLK